MVAARNAMKMPGIEINGKIRVNELLPIVEIVKRLSDPQPVCMRHRITQIELEKRFIVKRQLRDENLFI